MKAFRTTVDMIAVFRRGENPEPIRFRFNDRFGKEKVIKVDKVVDLHIDNMRVTELWHDHTPLWLRPQGEDYDMYKPNEFLQVVGHTPVKEITQEKSVLSCDTFSTHPDGSPIGTCEFALIDTETWEWTGVK